MARRPRLTAALVGVVVTLALSFLPFSTLFGGVASGFLAGPGTRDGGVAGTLSGLVLLIPAAILVSIGAVVVVFVLELVGAPPGGTAGVAVFFAILYVAVFCYVVVPSAVGGIAGAWVADAYPDRRRRARARLGLDGSTDASPTAAADREVVRSG